MWKELKNAYVFDCEGNGLTPDKFWCLAALSVDSKNKPRVTDSYEDMKKFLTNGRVSYRA